MGLTDEGCVRRKACTEAGGQIDFQSRETDGDNERWEENKQRDATCCVQAELLIGRVVMRRRAEGDTSPRSSSRLQPWFAKI